MLALFTVGDVYASLCKKGAYAPFSAQRRSRASRAGSSPARDFNRARISSSNSLAFRSSSGESVRLGMVTDLWESAAESHHVTLPHGWLTVGCRCAAFWERGCASSKLLRPRNQGLTLRLNSGPKTAKLRRYARRCCLPRLTWRPCHSGDVSAPRRPGVGERRFAAASDKETLRVRVDDGATITRPSDHWRWRATRHRRCRRLLRGVFLVRPTSWRYSLPWRKHARVHPHHVDDSCVGRLDAYRESRETMVLKDG